MIICGELENEQNIRTDIPESPCFIHIPYEKETTYYGMFRICWWINLVSSVEQVDFKSRINVSVYSLWFPTDYEKNQLSKIKEHAESIHWNLLKKNIEILGVLIWYGITTWRLENLIEMVGRGYWNLFWKRSLFKRLVLLEQHFLL